MKFASVPVANALGHLLAHATAGRKKGHTLTREDIEFLVASGISHVTTASLDPEDVHEDQAAASISAALNGANCTLSPAHTGRVNILAAAPGLAIVHANTVDRINAIHESITLATLRPFERIESRQMLATVKIIPFSAPQWAVRKAGQLARVGPLSVAPFVSKRIALISTSVPGMKQALLEKTRAVLDQRVRALGSNIISEQRVTHDASAIAGAISECMATQPDILLIMGASAITDRADSVPAGIIDAGGTIEHFGMPVDPGNLLLLAEIRGTPVIGVPGCARSPKLNGLDFVLQRICAGVPMTAADIKVMGVGGLLKEIPTRPHPREKQTSVAPGHHIEAIVLAAGRSTRIDRKSVV